MFSNILAFFTFRLFHFSNYFILMPSMWLIHSFQFYFFIIEKITNVWENIADIFNNISRYIISKEYIWKIEIFSSWGVQRFNSVRVGVVLKMIKRPRTASGRIHWRPQSDKESNYKSDLCNWSTAMLIKSEYNTLRLTVIKQSLFTDVARPIITQPDYSYWMLITSGLRYTIPRCKAAPRVHSVVSYFADM